MHSCQNVSLPVLRLKDNHVVHNPLNYKIHPVSRISKYVAPPDVHAALLSVVILSAQFSMNLFSKKNARSF